MGAIVVVRATGHDWRDDPAYFPRTTWHAHNIATGKARAVCGFTFGQRRAQAAPRALACPSCLRILGDAAKEATLQA